MDRLPLAIIASLLAVAACPIWFLARQWKPRRQPRHDPRDNRPEGDEPYLAREVRRVLHPEAYGEDWTCCVRGGCRGHGAFTAETTASRQRETKRLFPPRRA